MLTTPQLQGGQQQQHRPAPTQQRLSALAPLPPRQQQALPARQQPVPHASAREPKDPARFKSMEDAREYLALQSRGGAGPISGLLNWVSNAAFGASRAAALYRQWLGLGADAAHSNSSSQVGAAAALPSAAPEDIASLALVMLVSEHRVQKLAATFPQVLTMPPADVAARLVLLKELFPGADVARMVELAPGLLLGASEADLHAAQGRVAVLTQHLPGADMAWMIQEDPSLAFEDLEPSLSRLYELWPELDASTLAASDTKHLALALRALSDQGPPKRF